MLLVIKGAYDIIYIEVKIMIGSNIRKIRTEKGISQEELALRLCVVRQTLSKWERGISAPDSQMLLKIAKELDVNVNELLYEPNSEEAVMSVTENGSADDTRKGTSPLLMGIFISLGSLSFLVLLYYIMVCISKMRTITNINGGGITGGADIPTMIYVLGNGKDIVALVLALTVFICSVIGVIRVRRRKK